MMELYLELWLFQLLQGVPPVGLPFPPGDLIMAIDNTSTETMDIYDAAERLE